MAELLEEKIFDLIGNIDKINFKKSFKLSAHIISKFNEDRLIYIGDSAHSIHPIAGQGWNIAVRDIYKLSKLLDEALSNGLDFGSNYICNKYNTQCYYDAFSLYQITDILNSIFLNHKGYQFSFSDLILQLTQ